jgi:hypothetical protein
MEKEDAMREDWDKMLACQSRCERCGSALGSRDPRFLSVEDHRPICADCKRREERRPDYADLSRRMIAECIAREGKPYGDPAGYCFHHFCPFTCRSG